ncbi:TetR/AcrR family transcriptional regulator [Bartonella tamiae]|uniref:HTH tetR-type domain-containing protein n=1 Tax=Bartonella tamiae Th239 TaxID=1094558 RepID=J1K1T3_9HYPH|nr:TetR/AcrR family transcriptional regulator [Bartonella tamiae]EJF91030.1 hypothetical protein ME5_00362 [Bartonella tamiae Th239]EJF93305.1 hypothetical protein MEG_01519 [Bartonella tamiae Th307]
MNHRTKKISQILNAAAELIVENGLETSMAAIAKRAHIATGSLYLYFESKDAMIRALYHRLAQQLENSLVKTDHPMHTDQERIQHYIDCYIDFIWEDPKRAVLFEYLSNVPLISPEEMVVIFEKTSKYSSHIFLKAQKAGLTAPYNEELLTSFIGGGIRNSLKWHRILYKNLSQQHRKEISKMCWSAITL